MYIKPDNSAGTRHRNFPAPVLGRSGAGTPDLQRESLTPRAIFFRPIFGLFIRVGK